MHNLPLQFLGGGNMADAIIAGLIAAGHATERILVVEPDARRAEALRSRHGVEVLAPGAPLQAEAVTVLAVKPQVAAEALAATPVPAGSWRRSQSQDRPACAWRAACPTPRRAWAPG